MSPTRPEKKLIRVLVVDDEEAIRRAWRWMLPGDEFEVLLAPEGKTALAILAAEPVDVVVSDVHMPGMSGLELLEAIRQEGSGVEVLMMTGFGTIPDAVKAMQAGAFDYLTKPFKEIDDCINRVRQAARLKRLREENETLRQQVDGGAQAALLETRSAVMKRVNQEVAQVARVHTNVLVTGPTGSGKGIIARAIHDRSARCKGPFVAVDCGAIPAHLVESELYGHRKGAIQGAHRDKVGLFELARGGTIFLDEIGNMPMEMQKRLLKVLQEQVVRPVGGDRDIPVDVRVVSSSLFDLRKAIEQGEFRGDLYFRLKVVQITLPGLRERAEDIPRLAYHFLRRHGAQMGKEIASIHPDAMSVLERYPWTGNIRELENVIEAALVFQSGEELLAEHLPADVHAGASAGDAEGDAMDAQVDLDLPFREALDRADRAFRVTYLRGVMNRYRSVSAAARHAQMDRANFRRLLRRYDITDYPRGDSGRRART
jgi:DNA-binding NtrC family response regulator